MVNQSPPHPWRRWVVLIGLVTLAACSSTPDRPAEEPVADGAGTSMAATVQDAGSTTPGEDAGRYELRPGTGRLVKEAPPAPSFKQSGGNITLNFEGADVREVVRTVLGDILKENYIVDPRVAGSITLRTIRPIPKSAALHTLEEVLRMNGTVIVREADGVFRIVPFALAGKGNVTPQLADRAKPLPDGYSIQLVPLQYIGAVDMAKMLEPLAGEAASVRHDPVRNLLILAGTQLQLRHMLDTIDMFDVDWIAGMSVGLFKLKNTDAKALLADLEKVLGDKSLGPLAGAVRVVPIERLNALLVVTPQARYLEEARKWVERIDRAGAGSSGQQMFVYPVQNGKAELLAALLNEAFTRPAVTQKTAQAANLAPGLKPAEVKTNEPADNAPRLPATPAASGDSFSVPQNVRVIADTDNNALIIMANAADYENIESVIRKLDIVPRQVLIEVTIAEITLKDELTYGLEWFFKNGSRISGQLDTGKSGIGALVPGFSYSWISPSTDVTAVLNALATDSKLKVISSPHVTVADNQTAKIQVGNKVPTISQTQSVSTTTTSTGIISTVQYIETGVLLSVKPRINAGGLVSMEVAQEVSNAIATTTSGIDSPTIQKRAAQSSVTIQSGQTLVLAGLISEENKRTSEGLPLLSSIPILGGLFGTESQGDNRTELIILITPRVLENVQEASQVTDEYRRRLSGLQNLMRDAGVAPETTSLRLDASLKPTR